MTNPRERILEKLEEPGSRTKTSLVDELEGDVEPTEVVRALGDLLIEGEIREHPEIEGAYLPSGNDS